MSPEDRDELAERIARAKVKYRADSRASVLRQRLVKARARVMIDEFLKERGPSDVK